MGTRHRGHRSHLDAQSAQKSECPHGASVQLGGSSKQICEGGGGGGMRERL
jgi:hypothetical protein